MLPGDKAGSDTTGPPFEGCHFWKGRWSSTSGYERAQSECEQETHPGEGKFGAERMRPGDQGVKKAVLPSILSSWDPLNKLTKSRRTGE